MKQRDESVDQVGRTLGSVNHLVSLPGDDTVSRQGDGLDRLCSKCKKAPPRPGQWYCRGCHNAQMKRYRGHYRNEVTRLKRLIDNMTIRNAATLRNFEEKVGRTRRVIVTSDDGSRIRCSGEVIEFKPRNMVSLITRGEVITVPLDVVRRDRDRVPLEPEDDEGFEFDKHSGAKHWPPC